VEENQLDAFSVILQNCVVSQNDVIVQKEKIGSPQAM